ncbi:uncharacterized protein BXZ73DRAFT_105632 [Epithele typhae]|uniref:uncharacterized protein n=1 Tax=Epithele typhae TaxID=378194 RepID=UPI002008627D|nr:uncharacterized protein BXZ73DRAFT_105632 [Epithele typhae]KAH9917160.1 hypothetical protein BXZ73DRAFT_105632 [Epithele typhae]
MSSTAPSEGDPVAQIILSSALLAQFRYVLAASQSSQHHSQRGYEDPSIKPWNALSFLIATGAVSDETASKVVAVSGVITSGRITGFLVSRNAVPALVLPLQKVINPLQHIGDVVNVAQFFATTPKGHRPKQADFCLFLFCVSRCLPKLTSRFEHGDLIWDGPSSDTQVRTKASDGDNSRHPTTAIYNMLRTTPPKRIGPNALIYLSRGFRIYFKKAKIPLSPHSDTHDAYPITNENAVDWAQLLMDSFQKMRTYFCDLRSKWRVLEGDTASFSLQAEESSDAFETMKLFRALLDAGVIKHLITPDVEAELQEMRQRSEESKSCPVENLVNWAKKSALSTRGCESTYSFLLTQMGATSVPEQNTYEEDAPDEDVLEAADDDDEEVADARTDPNDSVEHHLVLRHLRTVTLPLDIIATFTDLPMSQGAGNAPAVQAVYVDHPPAQPVFRPDNFADIEKKIEPFLPAKQTAGSLPDPGDGPFASVIFPAIAKWPNKLGNQVMQKVNGASVHAEAALMARAWLSQNGDGSAASSEGEKLIQDVLLRERIPVGVSKKCCFCCDYLAQLLAEPSEDGRPGVKFVLSGTHSTVFPWVPPSGLPRAVLVKLAKRLTDTLDEAIKTSSKDVGSTQTTPLHASAPLPACAGEDEDEFAREVRERIELVLEPDVE